MTATRVSSLATQWTLNVDRDVCPGFYGVTNIIPNLPNIAGSLDITDVTYGYSLPSTRRNNITSALEARFTKYQTAQIKFDYVPASEDVSAEFIVTFSCQPDIKEIQDLYLSDEERLAGADYLVRAVVPCQVSVQLSLVQKRGSSTVPILSVKKDIYDYINSLEIGETLSASTIIMLCHKYDIKQVALPIRLEGILTLPSDSGSLTRRIMSTDNLEIPFLPEYGVSANNTSFFTNYFDATGSGDNIGVTLS